MKKIYFLVLIFITVRSFGQTAAPLSVNIQDPVPLCNNGDCTDLFADFNVVKETTSYQVQSIGYAPLFPFTGGTVLDASYDDVWSPVFELPFSFCFYGQKYSRIMVGSNGVVTFNIAPSVPGGIPGGVEVPLDNLGTGNCNWSFNQSLPSAGFHTANAIYGVYQDTNITNAANAVTNPAVQNVNYYVTGTAPNRIFIANFNELPQYQCGASSGLQTSQVLLYETTNVIDILISKRTPCNSWQGGVGVVGIQNQSGTLASIPPGRNTGAWSATNEAWRFSPNGNSTATLSWSLNGMPIPGANNTNPITVCPSNQGGVYQATVSYADCDGTQTLLSDAVTLNIEQGMSVLADPSDMSVCVAGSQPGTFDLTANNATILNGANPIDFNIHYFNSPSFTTMISNAAASAFVSSGQTIGVLIESEITGCSVTKTFDLIVNSIPAPPTGSALQTFVPGETLGDIELNENNIVWFSQENGGINLPNSTQLTNATTYYAARENVGCLSGKSNPGRLAVTVYNALSNPEFAESDFKIYPNPVKDVLNLSYSKEISNVSVHNLLGQIVMAKTLNNSHSQLNLSDLPDGTYLIKVTVDGLVKTIKIIKE